MPRSRVDRARKQVVKPVRSSSRTTTVLAKRGPPQDVKPTAATKRQKRGNDDPITAAAVAVPVSVRRGRAQPRRSSPKAALSSTSKSPKIIPKPKGKSLIKARSKKVVKPNPKRSVAKKSQKTKISKVPKPSIKSKIKTKINAAKAKKDAKIKELKKASAVSPAKRKRSKKEALDPKPNVSSYDVDPLFHSNTKVPHVSTLAHSRLVHRAVLLKDVKLLKKLLTNEASLINSLSSIQSALLPDSEKPLEIAIRTENREAVKILLDNQNDKIKFGQCPDLLIQSESTGYSSKMMFGHGMRAVTVGRGGKEGNAALLKDRNQYRNSEGVPYLDTASIRRGIHDGISDEMLEFLLTFNKDRESALRNDLYYNLDDIIRSGNVRVAGKLISNAVTRGGFGFNFLHEQALVNKTEPFSEFKPISVLKKSVYGSRLTPVHCAAINPNPYYVRTLLDSSGGADHMNVPDKQNWLPIHFASVCEGDEPLKLLLSRGASPLAVEKGDGNTPLHLAIKRNRVKNVKAILTHEQKELGKGEVDDENDNKKPNQSNSSLEKPNKAGYRPLHHAAKIGNTAIIQALLQAGADPEKFTPAQFEKLTPLMIACQFGRLESVKVLVEHGVKVGAEDKRKRTAIFHAVMNGHAHVVSYLLRHGVQHQNVKDSSGNTLAHYAAAYGWYFVMKLLMEAGCDVTTSNDWKLTPVAIAFMKGHMGIVEMLVKEPGVDINVPVDGDTGMTLLHAACASASLKSSIIPRLKFLVDDLNADCKTLDYGENNALHHLASHRLYENQDFQTMFENLWEAVKFLIDHGCNMSALNASQRTPLHEAFRVKNYWIAGKLIDQGINLTSAVADAENGNTLLHVIASNASALYFKHNKLYLTLAEDKTNLNILKQMAGMRNKNGVTPLHQMFLEIRSGIDEEGVIQRIVDFAEFLVKTLGSDVNSHQQKEDDKEPTSFLLHAAVNTPYFVNVLPILQNGKNKLELDPLDRNGLAPLSSLVLGPAHTPDHQIVKALLDAGANVNVTCKVGDHKLGLPLLVTVKQPTLYPLIPDLLKKKANFKETHPVGGNGPLHYIIQHPKVPGALTALKALVEAGISIVARNKDGRTPLHLLVNSRWTETDVEYDMEDFILLSSAGRVEELLEVKDIRGRTPLHYVFVKIGKPLDKSNLDPIELLMTLLNRVRPEKRKQLINIKDAFGSTILHYAAMRGATICCSYLTTEMGGGGRGIDVKDNRGNTPFGLSVWCRYEATALHFLQNGADFLHMLDTNITVIEVNKGKKKGRWGNSESGSDSDSDESDNDDDNSSNKGSENEAEKEPEETEETKPEVLEWTWDHKTLQDQENQKSTLALLKYPIIQQVVKHEWQGILHLMSAKLLSTTGISVLLEAALKTEKFTLALKFLRRVRDGRKELHPEIIHRFAQYSNSHVSLQLEFLKMLVDKGVDANKGDSPHSTKAICYAAMNQNLPLVQALVELTPTNSFDPDKLGRTPFSAVFWKLDTSKDISKEMKEWISSSLFKRIYSANLLSSYPCLLSVYPGVRCLIKHRQDNEEAKLLPKYSPLIVAVIHGRYSVVQWLLQQKPYVDPNFPDDLGRTPLMHACRLNDLKMVKILLDPNYEFEKDPDPWGKDYSKQKPLSNRAKINLSAKDNKGWTAVDYVVSPSLEGESTYSYYNVTQILTILSKLGASFSEKSGTDRKSPMERAVARKQSHIVQVMYDLMKTPARERVASTNGTIGESISSMKKDKVDFISDAKTMIEKKLQEQPPTEEFVIRPDPLLTAVDPNNSEVLVDPTLQIPLDCLLTQVDLSWGMHGIYNFYKMQVVKQLKGRELIVLFTQWGRVGMEGQNQQTPFPTEAEALAEFKKIFRAKTGNAWDQINEFKPVPKRYRLIRKELRGNKQAKVDIDFEKLEKKEATEGKRQTPASMTPEVYSLMKSLMFVHKNATQHSSRNEASKASILLPETLKKADKILGKIKSLLVKKDKIHQESGTTNLTEVERLAVFDELIEASVEFYSLIPVEDFASQAVQPILDFSDLRKRQNGIYGLLHFGFAKELILAAEYNLERNRNPLEYIYQCLGTNLNPLKQKSFEAQLILQFIQNSSSNTKVQCIYSVQGAEEHKEVNLDNRWLLWHGSDSENILSILSSGLQIEPPGVNCTVWDVQLFGKGVYFADTFTKSLGYCHSRHGRVDSNKYMFLCEVALGNIYNVDVDMDLSGQPEGVDKPLPKGFHSLRTSDSRYIPDPATTIVWDGKVMPLGPPTNRVIEEGKYHGLDYNEYIVFNPQQVKIKYLVEFK